MANYLDIAKQIIRQRQPGEPNRKALSSSSEVYWESVSGTLNRPAEVQELYFDGAHHWVLVEVQGAIIWVRDDRLR